MQTTLSMRAESLSALIVSSDDAFCRSVADCLRWSGAERALRVRTGKAARAELSRKRFFYSVIVIHIIEDSVYDVDFIEGLIRSRDMALRSIPCVAVASATSRAFYAELGQLGFRALVPAPINRVLLRDTFLSIFKELQKEYRNPDLRLLKRALSSGDLDFVEERCTRALQHQADHRSYSAYLGEVYFRQGHLQKALEKSEAAIVALDGGSNADGYRLKAKVLHKMGRSSEAWDVLPFLLKQAGDHEHPCIQGLVPLMNAYAAHLKAAGQVEEALIYYNRALSEPDAREYESPLYLNIALAHMMAQGYLQAYEAAERSLALSGGQSRKAKDLMLFLRKNHPEVFAPDAPAKATLEEKVGAGAIAQKARRQAAHSAQEEDSSSVHMSPEELAALEAELTEDTDLPDSTQAIADDSAHMNPQSVFQAMEQLGGHEGDPFASNDELSFGGTLDSLGDDLFAMEAASPTDFDFEVSADQIALAKEAQAKQLEEFQAQTASLQASASFNLPSSDLDSVLEAALSPQSFESSDALFEPTGMETDLSADLLSLADEIHSQAQSPKSKMASSINTGEISDPRPGLDSDLASLLQRSVSSPKPGAQTGKTAEQKKIKGAQAAESNPGLLATESQAVPSPEEDESASSHRIKWDVMSRDQIMEFLLFKKEHPPIKVKRLKVQPRRRHGSLVPVD